jgi:hypothetical protein
MPLTARRVYKLAWRAGDRRRKQARNADRAFPVRSADGPQFFSCEATAIVHEGKSPLKLRGSRVARARRGPRGGAAPYTSPTILVKQDPGAGGFQKHCAAAGGASQPKLTRGPPPRRGGPAGTSCCQVLTADWGSGSTWYAAHGSRGRAKQVREAGGVRRAASSMPRGLQRRPPAQPAKLSSLQGRDPRRARTGTALGVAELATPSAPALELLGCSAPSHSPAQLTHPAGAHLYGMVHAASSVWS